MAIILDSVAIPRSSSVPKLTVSPIAGSLVNRRSVRLPEAKGLKVGFSSLRSHSFGSVNQSLVRSRSSRSGRVICEAQETAVEVPSVTDATWNSLILESKSPVLVEFWAPWCGPCRMIHPVIDELAKQYAGKLKCYKVNTDESPSIATRYGIRSIPTVIIFKNGEKQDAVIGAVPKTTLTSSIEKYL